MGPLSASFLKIKAHYESIEAENKVLRKELDAAKAHIAVLKDKARWALVDLNGLLNDQKMNMDDGSYKFDGQNGYELDEALTKTSAQSLADIQAKAILKMTLSVNAVAVFGSDDTGTIKLSDVINYANKLTSDHKG